MAPVVAFGTQLKSEPLSLAYGGRAISPACLITSTSLAGAVLMRSCRPPSKDHRRHRARTGQLALLRTIRDLSLAGCLRGVEDPSERGSKTTNSTETRFPNVQGNGACGGFATCRDSSVLCKMIGRDCRERPAPIFCRPPLVSLRANYHPKKEAQGWTASTDRRSNET